MVKVVAELPDTCAGFAPVALPTAVVGCRIIDFGAAPYALLKLNMVSQVVGEPVEPAVMVNEPAASVEPAVTAALGPVPVPQLIGVPIVGVVVCRDLT